jgi:hypothetical protein
MIKVAFLYIGGMHQVFHTAAVAAEMSRRDEVEVHCLYASADILSVFSKIAETFDAGPIIYTNLSMSPRWETVLRTLNIPKAHKLLRLHSMRRELNGFDAIVTPERTSAVLRNWLAPSVKLIHFKHGVGDGQKGFESRLKSFDMVAVSGEKDRERLYRDGVIELGKCTVTGSVKLATIEKLQNGRCTFFNNDRPTVLYNPHFNESLGSWSNWGRKIVDTFASQSDFNLILAPHIRMFENATASEREAFEAMSIPGKIIADSGSIASCDMSYTVAADIFLGDVSSQAYEFISTPRPCVFLNSHGVQWKDDKNYAFWQFGDVVSAFDDLFVSLKQAAARHSGIYRELQTASLARAIGVDCQTAPARSVSAVINCIQQRLVKTENVGRLGRMEHSSASPGYVKEDAA